MIALVSQYPPPPPPGAYASPTVPPRRPRPSGWWWAAVGGLIVLALVSFVLLLALAWRSIAGTVEDYDSVPVDGSTHTVRLDAGETGYLWLPGESVVGPVTCDLRDAATDESLAVRGVGGRLEVESNGDSFSAFSRFDTGSGTVEVTCGGAPGRSVLVGPDPDIGRSIGLVVATFVVPPLLGMIGIAWLIVLAVLTATRPARVPGGQRP